MTTNLYPNMMDISKKLKNTKKISQSLRAVAFCVFPLTKQQLFYSANIKLLIPYWSNPIYSTISPSGNATSLASSSEIISSFL